MADIVIKQIEEGMTGRQVADLLYQNFLALVGAIGSGGGGDIPVADIEKGVTAYGWGDHRQAGYLKGITGGMVTGALGYTPMDEAAWTKANIKATLGIADWALAASKPTYKTNEVAEDGNLYFTDARAVAALAGVTDALAGDIGANATAIGVLQGYFTNGVAKSAAKLATSRKLWGQLFNGEADVTGALTGVTDITASGVLTIGKIKIGDGVIEWDATNGGFKVTGGLWATDYLSSKGVNTGASGGGGGSSYQRLDTWDGYTTAKDGWVLSAKLGYGLKTTQDDILRQLADISGQGTNVTFTPSLTSGTQIGTLTIDGEPVNMYAPSIPTSDIEKGVTAYGWGDHSKAGYLTQHQDLSGYQTKITSSNKLAASLVSGLSAVATSGKYSDLSGTPTSLPASDVSAWAKAASKPTYKFSEITEKPTTIGGYGITDAYTKSQVDSALGGYLPLSGGTLSSNNFNTLHINSNDSGIKRSAIVFTYNKVTKTQIGWDEYQGMGSYLYNYASNVFLGIKDDGIPYYYNGAYNTIIHSGNIGSQSVASANRLLSPYTYEHNTLISNDTTAETLLPESYAFSAMMSGSPWSAYGFASVFTFSGYRQYGGSQIALQYNSTIARMAIRNYNQSLSGWNDWHEVAFIDSNVASATKLQTARSIWGQSFDGTKDILYNNVPSLQYIYFVANDGTTKAGFFGRSNPSNNNLYLHANSGSELHLGSNDVDSRLIVSLSGNVMIGTNTDNGYKLDVNGEICSNRSYRLSNSTYGGLFSNNIISSGGNASDIWLYNANKLILYGSSVDVRSALNCSYTIYAATGIWSDGYVSAKGQNTSSDMRLKRVLEEVTLSVDEIAAAPAVRFAWKGGAGVDVGTSAQYWEKVLPDVVKRDDAGWLTMQYGNAAMVAVIALARRVQELEKQLRIMNYEL